MSSIEIRIVLLTLSILLASTHVAGYLFVRLRQPRLVGEILAGFGVVGGAGYVHARVSGYRRARGA